MASLKLPRISLAEPDAAGRLAALRSRLGAQGDVVSPRSRELTLRVFGEALPPAKVVERICNDVRSRGLAAVLHYTEKLDGARLQSDQLKAGTVELQDAHAAADPSYLELIRRVRQNILSFQLGLLHRDAVMSAAGYELRLRYRPIRRVGICVPGGAAAYPSTLLMTVCPAQAAGVGRRSRLTRRAPSAPAEG